ncbi:MAG: Type 1 glutamine amidotransferase-like domain-containing protein [Chloroflexota bacterium]|nr:Type 1 glutamine amidotransferase-like domain-containing protein [Chloroflexota bacterium]
MSRRIVACGGRELFYPTRIDYVFSLARRPRPRVAFLGTASGDSPDYLLTFYQQLAGRDCEPTHLELYHRTVDDIDAFFGDQDLIIVGRGNTANMLAVWRLHGVDRALRAAYEAGTVLTGWSAGCICWFEGGTTDSFTPELGALRDGLGYPKGSATPTTTARSAVGWSTRARSRRACPAGSRSTTVWPRGMTTSGWSRS